VSPIGTYWPPHIFLVIACPRNGLAASGDVQTDDGREGRCVQKRPAGAEILGRHIVLNMGFDRRIFVQLGRQADAAMTRVWTGAYIIDLILRGWALLAPFHTLIENCEDDVRKDKSLSAYVLQYFNMGSLEDSRHLLSLGKTGCLPLLGGSHE
jgi:hypothetical protein